MKTAKILFFIVIASLIVVPLLLPFIGKNKGEKPTALESKKVERQGDNAVPLQQPIKNWSYTHFDGDEVAGEFSGEEARIVGTGEYDLVKPSAVIYTKPDTPEDISKKVLLSAHKGHYSDADRTLLLSDSVIAEIEEDKAKLTADELLVETTKRTITTKGGFLLTKPDIECSGKGLVADDSLSKVKIQENAYIKRADQNRATYIYADSMEIDIVKRNESSRSNMTADYEISNLVATSSRFSKVVTNNSIIESAKIIGQKEADVILLKGPKRLTFNEYIATSDGDAVFDSANKLARFSDNAKVGNKDFTILADNIAIKLSEDGKNVEDIIAIGSVSVFNKADGTTIYGESLKRNLVSGAISVTGSPYVSAIRGEGTLKVGELIFNQKNKTIEGRKGKQRSVLQFRYEKK
ncbi:MAG: hypothetical protein A2W23_05925 [Planctomycetes bacterium RBG_16_43_13]|nr:MAG: hypothetical protein A2W23_05925 [Planctomycetes bacterium RBG_16_43_13]